jgi:hypothetical protein
LTKNEREMGKKEEEEEEEEERKLTNAWEGESGGALDGCGATEEDEAGAVVLGGGHGGEGMAAPWARGVLRSLPAGLLQRTVCWRGHHPGLLGRRRRRRRRRRH